MAEEDGSDVSSVASEPPDCPAAGLYRHYKGRHYRVLGCVRHSESEEWLVLYRALYGARGLWVRPLGMFVGTIERDGRACPRFSRVEGAETPVDPVLDRPET